MGLHYSIYMCSETLFVAGIAVGTLVPVSSYVGIDIVILSSGSS